MLCVSGRSLFFFFKDTATTEIYTLSLHDALPISGANGTNAMTVTGSVANINAALQGLSYLPSSNYSGGDTLTINTSDLGARSEEHTSELQSRQYLVCRLLLEKKNATTRFA